VPTLVWTAVVATALALPASVQAAPLYTPRFIPELEGTALNNRGEIVGTRGLSGVPLLWRDGDMVRLPTPGSYTVPTAINDRGDIAGWVRHGGGRGESAIVWTDGAARVLDRLGGRHAGAFDINEARLIVGFSEYRPKGWRRHPVVWNGQPRPISAPWAARTVRRWRPTTPARWLA
jgi:hypothetical protein